MDSLSSAGNPHEGAPNDKNVRSRRDSVSQKSEDSQTAADFIRDQMQLEADAREALPYSIKNCTKPLGSLRQNIYACLTCNPPPSNADEGFGAAGICYACSVQCHGEHDLVEIFQKRNFTCDCGTTRFKPEHPCILRFNSDTNTQGNVHSEQPDPNNKYNQNFRNLFCSCAVYYDPVEQKGTMFQCLGLGNHETGGCGEDWYHPGCLVGQGPKWFEKLPKRSPPKDTTGSGALAPIAEGESEEGGIEQVADEADTGEDEDEEDEDVPLPDGFPEEDDFQHFICYKCVEAYPWIKRYAGTSGFLSPVFLQKAKEEGEDNPGGKKRKMEEEDDDESGIEGGLTLTKRVKKDAETEAEQPETEAEQRLPNTTDSANVPTEVKGEDEKAVQPDPTPQCKFASLPPAPQGVFSLFAKEDFRDHLCHCPRCFPNLKPHPQLLEQEEEYEPPLSDLASANGSTNGSGSLYERGESALKNVDRVRAIEGVMAYNNLKEKLKPFFQQFAESGKAIGAEDIKEYFEKLRGDDRAIKEAGNAAKEDKREEQSGY
ncbi:hypothetical protein GGS20DRAFT_578212 [Poronia punctata]|nr:hypothetical protein GGS20DRAFT_578212 [Poronia punctata]